MEDYNTIQFDTLQHNTIKYSTNKKATSLVWFYVICDMVLDYMKFEKS